MEWWVKNIKKAEVCDALGGTYVRDVCIIPSEDITEVALIHLLGYIDKEEWKDAIKHFENMGNVKEKEKVYKLRRMIERIYEMVDII